MPIYLVVPRHLCLDGDIVASINDASALAFWVKMKAHGVDKVRLSTLRDKAKPWGFATGRFNSAMRVLTGLGLVDIYKGAANRKWVTVK